MRLRSPAAQLAAVRQTANVGSSSMSNNLNESVKGILDELVGSGHELGLQAAAYVDGELVVDAWSGTADQESGRLVDGETLFSSWSTTKGFTSTCLHILADRGLLDYPDTVATYWPEFSAAGKEAVTVHQVLTHSAGVPQVPEGVTPEMSIDWEVMTAAIADLEPVWLPGSKSGYHAHTFGWIVGEIVRRIDGRSIARFAQEELCQPLGIRDFYLGIPDDVEDRVAPLVSEP